MRNIATFCRNIFKNLWFAVFCFGDIICIILHQYSIKNLKLPVGIKQLLTFLFTNPADYFKAILAGAISWIIWFALISSIVVALYDIFLNDQYEFECIEIKVKVELVIKIAVAITLVVINTIFAGYTFILILLIILLATLARLLIWLYNK